MTTITGPVAMTLLEKNNVRYLLIADRHNAYNKNGCDSNSLMLHEYLDNLFRSKDQWDFYIEQGAYGIERGEEDKEHAKFLSEAKKEFTAKQLQIYLNKYKKSIKEEADMLGGVLTTYLLLSSHLCVRCVPSQCSASRATGTNSAPMHSRFVRPRCSRPCAGK